MKCNTAINAANIENYTALLISIIRRVNPEQAFIILNRGDCNIKTKRRLTDKDYEQIRMRRLAGETWNEISATYGKTANSLRQSYHSNKRGETK